MLFALAERFELAARLAQRWADSGIVVELATHDIADHVLVARAPGRMPLWRDRSRQATSWSQSWTLSQLAAADSAKALALEAALDRFALFGWAPAPQLLNDQVEELRWPT